MKTKEFKQWLGTELYLAARDAALIRYGTLKEVWIKAFGEVPRLSELEQNYGEHKVK